MTGTEDDLVSRYQRSGSRQDYEALVKNWLPSIRRFLALHLGRDTQACEEVQQEILVSLLGDLSGFNGRSQFSTFLYRLVRNKAIDYRRKEKRRTWMTVPIEEVELGGGLAASTGDDPLEVLVRKDAADRLFALIMTLPLPDRELLYFREIEDLGEKECSVLLGKPVGTLKSRLHRIKKKLFLKMTEEGVRP